MEKMNSFSWFLVWTLFVVLLFSTPLGLVIGITRQFLGDVLGALGVNVFLLPTVLSYTIVFGAIWLIAYSTIRWNISP